VTSPIEAEPQYVIQMPGPSWTHFVAAIFTAAFFLLLTVKIVVPAVICGAIAIAACLGWTWSLDPGPGHGPVDIGAEIRLPVYATGPTSHSWWAMVVLMLVAGSLYLAYVFSYLYLWTVAPQVWAGSGSPNLPAAKWPIISGLLFLLSITAYLGAARVLPLPLSRNLKMPVLLTVGTVCLVGGVAVEIVGHWQTGLRATANSYSAMVYMASALTAQVVAAVVIMSLFTGARYATGKLDRQRRVTFDNTALLAVYAAGQGLVGVGLIHGFPRLIG
jgi:cytochrome c oxidase subunit I+III